MAGNGTAGYSGDGGPAVNAQLNVPGGVALDAAGNLYIFDSGNLRVRKVSTSGIITTVAGNGAPGFSGDGGPATQAEITAGGGLAVDRSGNLYIADTSNQRIRRVAPDGTITTVAGDETLMPGEAPGAPGEGVPATQSPLNRPMDVAVDGAGNIYIAEMNIPQVVSPAGIIRSVPGSPGPASDPFIGIASVAVDGAGNIYLADGTSRIRKITPTGVITTIAGPRGGVITANHSATGVTFSGPSGVAADTAGNVLIADPGNSFLWRVSPDRSIRIVGSLPMPAEVAVDGAGNYYAATSGEVWEAQYTGTVPPAPMVVAGGGLALGDGGPAVSAQVFPIGGVAVDGAGNLFIADIGTNSIRKVTPAGIITTVASGQLSFPRGVAVDGAGNLYIADTGNFRIRKVSTSGIITTVAGGGTVSGPLPNPIPTGDGGPATSAILDYPVAVAVDGSGNIYIADQGFSRIRKVTADGVINTIAGNGTQGYSGDGGPATSAALNAPVGIAVDNAGNVYVAEQGNNIVRLLKPTNAPVLIGAVQDAATESATALTPGKIVAIYGAGLGPAALALNAPSNGAFGTQVGGTSVTFNGTAAPMIYASSAQASAIVPYEIAGAATANVVVTSQSGVSAAFSVPVAAVAPSFFSRNGTGAGQIAAVNRNGVLNDAANPVAVGDYISLYATGEGQTVPAGVDGALATTVYPKPVLPVSVTVGGIAVTPVYAGAAPTEVLGLMQIVVQIPPGVTPGGYVPVQMQVGSGSTVGGAAWIAVSGN